MCKRFYEDKSITMSRKSKGINAERDLIHKFWALEKWGAVRIAGSGSMRYPSADILATNNLRILAIECKTSKEESKYFTKEEISQLKIFSNLFGAEPWIGMRFSRSDWFFINLEDLQEKKNSYFISKELIKKKGLMLEELIK